MGDINISSQNVIQGDFSKKSQISHFAEFSSGAGSTTLKIDKNGLFIGGTSYSDAPYSQDYNGKIRIKDSSGIVVILIDPNG